MSSEILLGYPSYFNAYLLQYIFETFAKYSNYTAIANKITNVLKAAHNETRHCYVIPLPRWIMDYTSVSQYSSHTSKFLNKAWKERKIGLGWKLPPLLW